MQRNNSKIGLALTVYVIASSVLPLTLHTEEKTLGNAQIYTVTIAEQKIPLLFEKEDTNPDLKGAIAEDLERILSHVDSLQWEELTRGPLEWRGLTLTHRLKGWKREVLPHMMFKWSFGAVTTFDGRRYLVIAEEMVVEYRERWQTLTDQVGTYSEEQDLDIELSDMLAELERFLELLNDREEVKKFVEATEGSDIRLFYPSEEEVTSEKIESLQSGMENLLTSLVKEEYEFITPSLLEVSLHADFAEKMGASEEEIEEHAMEAFFTLAPWQMRGEFIMKWPLIYQGGKWYLGAIHGAK